MPGIVRPSPRGKGINEGFMREESVFMPEALETLQSTMTKFAEELIKTRIQIS